MTGIALRLEETKKKLPSGVKLVAVSKTYPAEAVLEAYAAGQRIFGENKVQEMADKHVLCPADIEWHLIGHLQTNKVKYIAPFVSLIHSVDSLRLLQEIDKRAIANNRVIRCLLQIFIASEETKFGLDRPECLELLASDAYAQLKNVKISGLMGMASFSEDRKKVREEFRSLRNLFEEIKRTGFQNDDEFTELSMGMSNDMDIAMEEGATMVRVGTAIFGHRN